MTLQAWLKTPGFTKYPRGHSQASGSASPSMHCMRCRMHQAACGSAQIMTHEHPSLGVRPTLTATRQACCCCMRPHTPERRPGLHTPTHHPNQESARVPAAPQRACTACHDAWPLPPAAPGTHPPHTTARPPAPTCATNPQHARVDTTRPCRQGQSGRGAARHRTPRR